MICCLVWCPEQNQESLSSVHTYHSRFITEEVAEATQKFLRDARPRFTTII
jgi:hypothetical protein